MKKIIKFYILLFITLTNCTLQAQDITFSAGNETVLQGNQISVPIIIENGGIDLVSIQLTIDFDESIISYLSTENYNLDGIEGGDFGTSGVNNGQLTFLWTAPSSVPQTVPDGTTIFTVTFDAIGSVGDISQIDFTGVPTAIEVANSSLVVLNFIPQNGSVTITQDNSVAAPENFNANATSSTTIALNWDAVTNATEYEVFACNGDLIASTAMTNIVVDNLIPETTYSYKVRAINSSEVSEFSSCDSTTTLASTDLAINIGDECGINETCASVAVTVNAFENITSLQFSLSLADTTNMQFKQISNAFSSTNFFIEQVDTGAFTVVWWDDNPLGTTLANGDTLFLIELNLDGTLGSTGAIQITGTPTPIEISQSGMVVDATFNAGSMCIYETFSISGKVKDRDLMGVDSLDVVLGGSVSRFQLTNSTGDYLFDNLIVNNDYTVSASRTGNLLDGVDVLDIQFIRQHILTILPFDSPYKYIAADVNDSGTVTALDIFNIRQAVLIIADAFPINRSYAFIPENFIFPSLDNPFPYDTLAVLENVFTDTIVNFVGVKYGDINGNATYQRNVGGTINIGVTDILVKTDDIVSIPILVAGCIDSTDIVGWQWSVSWDTLVLKFLGIDSLNSALMPNSTVENSFNLNHIDKGMLAFLWDTPDGVPLQAEDSTILYSLKFEVIGQPDECSLIKIGSELTQSIAYNSSFEEVTIEDMGGKAIILTTKSDEVPNLNLEVSQNYPNPFNNETYIKFSLAESTDVQFIIYNHLGQAIKFFEGSYSAGSHTILWDGKDDFGRNASTGIYYGTFITDYGYQKIEMLLMK